MANTHVQYPRADDGANLGHTTTTTTITCTHSNFLYTNLLLALSSARWSAIPISDRILLYGKTEQLFLAVVPLCFANSQWVPHGYTRTTEVNL